MRKASLFSGIGGIDLAAHWAGMETVVFCEREPFPQRVLRKHWPDVPIIDDVHDFTREEMERRGIGAIDLISAGFPCQPFSHAGKREGAEDERYLWPEVVRVVDDIRPTWFVGENVAGILSMAQPDREIKVVNRISSRTEEEDFYEAVFTQQEVMLIHDICKDLENIGYQVQVYILPAAAVGASNPRDRVFLVAHTEIDTSGGLSIREGETDAGLARTCSDVEHPECIRCGGVTRRGTEPQPADRYSGGQGGVMADTSSEGLSQRGRSRRAEGNPEAGTGWTANLNDAVKLWPTPKASDAVMGMTARTSGRPIEKSTHLQTQVGLQEAKLWPTPHANCGGRCVKGGINHYRTLYLSFPERFQAQMEMEGRFRREINDYTLLKKYAGKRNGKNFYRPYALTELKKDIETGGIQEDLFIQAEQPCACIFFRGRGIPSYPDKISDTFLTLAARVEFWSSLTYCWNASCRRAPFSLLVTNAHASSNLRSHHLT